ncbi:MAG: DUF4301 family protein [Paludibacteraceae bacterium]|nr:DUF4301 family protein [Paludibacteraceae bacterium]
MKTQFTEKDLAQLASLGISVEQVEQQLADLKNGFPDLEIRGAATIGNGILKPTDEEKKAFLNTWDTYLQDTNHKVLKFVPASGAASRMFKNLFEFADNHEHTDFIKQFFASIHKFAFFDVLNKKCVENEGASIDQLIADGKDYLVVEELLFARGLNYGQLPKGLLLFHSYPDENRTPALEHLVEGVQYAKGADNIVNLHFTISPEHRTLFATHLRSHLEAYQQRYGVQFKINFSEQQKSTDTIAGTADNQPFRNDDGSLLFRPGGHGALIANLNDQKADVIFIKNIDNVVPDRLKEPTVEYKKLIAGILVSLQQQTFAYLRELENENISDAKLSIINQFCKSKLFNDFDTSAMSHDELRKYLIGKLNRPMRVCGMVKNEGEPGGGPYLTVNADGSVSPQILESSQIADPSWMRNATHFNPVDLVCATRDYKGNQFDLTKYVDKKTGFISSKSKNGRDLKALELPGLWNGAMSDWNTIFVEVPIETFNPVKTVNDLLRPQHQ